MAQFHDNIFSPERIREIQTEEMTAIKGMSIHELAARVEHIRTATRELALRLVKCNDELHSRLSSKDNPELESLIERVPAASATLAMRGHQNNKPKKETFEDKVKRNLDNKIRKGDPAMKEFMESLKAMSK